MSDTTSSPASSLSAANFDSINASQGIIGLTELLEDMRLEASAHRLVYAIRACAQVVAVNSARLVAPLEQLADRGERAQGAAA